MKTKILYGFLALCMLFSLVACTRGATTEYHPSGFDGTKLYINVDGDTLVYERYAPGIGPFTPGSLLDRFYTQTAIEGIVWEVYTPKELFGFSYVLVISGTNSSWTYRISEEAD